MTPETKKQYVILGDNNFWYSTFDAENQEQIDEEVDIVYQEIMDGGIYDDGPRPAELRVFEVKKKKKVNL